MISRDNIKLTLQGRSHGICQSTNNGVLQNIYFVQILQKCQIVGLLIMMSTVGFFFFSSPACAEKDNRRVEGKERVQTEKGQR